MVGWPQFKTGLRALLQSSTIKWKKGDTKMSLEKMSEGISLNRRRFLGTAAMTAAAAQLGVAGDSRFRRELRQRSHWHIRACVSFWRRVLKDGRA
jgi:hypothetical protein